MNEEQMKIKDGRDARLDGLTYCFLAIVYMELILRVFCLENILAIGIIYDALFAFGVACVFRFLASFFRDKVNRILMGILLFLCSAIYVAQVTYQMFFGKFLALYSMLIGGV